MQNSPHLLTFDVYILLMISITQSQIQMIVFNGMFDVHRGILLKDRPCYQSNDSIQSFTDCVVTCALNTSCQASFLTVYNLCGYCPPGSIYSVEPRKNETVAFPIGLKVSQITLTDRTRAVMKQTIENGAII
ncbi:unnamed protein product [Caenorhabditis brenneri]